MTAFRVLGELPSGDLLVDWDGARLTVTYRELNATLAPADFIASRFYDSVGAMGEGLQVFSDFWALRDAMLNSHAGSTDEVGL